MQSLPNAAIIINKGIEPNTDNSQGNDFQQICSYTKNNLLFLQYNSPSFQL
jgi:hypothetical protein